MSECLNALAASPLEALPIIIGELVALCVVLGALAFRRRARRSPPQS